MRSMNISLILLIFLNFGYAEAYKILVAYAHDSKSHLGNMIPLAKSLAGSGHSITIFHTSEASNPPQLGPNVSYVQIQVVPPKEAQEFRKNFLRTLQFHQTMHTTHMPGGFTIGDFALGIFMDRFMEKLSEVLNQHWDLVILDELFGMHAHTFAIMQKKFKKVPYIVFSTTLMVETTPSNMALSRPWVSKPCMFTSIPESPIDKFDSRKYYDRAYNFYENLVDLIWIGHIMPWSFENMARFLDHQFSWRDFYLKSSFSLSDTIDSIVYPLPEGTDTKIIGRYCSPSRNLEGEYKDFVEDPSSKGTIYIAFGSYIVLELAPQNFLNAIFEALEELKEYRIIFSYNGPPRNVSKHVLLTKWAPQVEILNHPKTKVYFTHGGLKSVKESICSKTPLVIMPLFAEQSHNAKMVLETGIGTSINKYRISKKLVLSSILEVIENHEYAKNMEKFYEIYHDSIMHPLEEGRFWVERVIKRSKLERKVVFGRQGMFLSWIEFMYLDVIICVSSMLWVVSK